MVQEMPEARKSCSPFYCLWARDVYVCVCVYVCVWLYGHTQAVCNSSIQSRLLSFLLKASTRGGAKREERVSKRKMKMILLK